MELLTQGAEARVYLGRWLNREVIVKKRFPKKYRHPVLDAQINKERIKAEAKALVRCHSFGIRVPILYDVNLETQELIMEAMQGCVSVRNYIYSNCQNVKNPMAEKGMKELAHKIGSCISQLHSKHMIHGDLTTSNILVSEKILEVVLIDFGLSFVGEQCEDKAVDLYVLERAIMSTHPNSEGFVATLLDAYAKSYGKNSKLVLNKLDDVRQRGRKKLCFG